MTSGFIILHGSTSGEVLHVNPDLLLIFFAHKGGSAIHLIHGDMSTPLAVTETPDEIEHLLARLHIAVEGTTH